MDADVNDLIELGYKLLEFVEDWGQMPENWQDAAKSYERLYSELKDK